LPSTPAFAIADPPTPTNTSFDVKETIRINFDGAAAVFEAFHPLLARSPGRVQVLSTSSGVGTRTMGLMREADRLALLAPELDTCTLQSHIWRLVEELAEEEHPYRSIPTVGYGLSKMGLNCLTQLWARDNPGMEINACSPGFTNTGMCANYTGKRQPKCPALGASVFSKVLYGELGTGRTNTFFKESSAPGTTVEEAKAGIDPWVAAPSKV
jgi:NAD(P)-dependent dehydrogenase (short-subunit alcohol dehydrogenase family)